MALVNLDTTMIVVEKEQFSDSFDIDISGMGGGADGAFFTATEKNGKYALVAKNNGAAEATIKICGGDGYFGGRDVLLEGVETKEMTIFSLMDIGRFLITTGEHKGKVKIEAPTDMALLVVQLP